jgi:hypothetical protein
MSDFENPQHNPFFDHISTSKLFIAWIITPPLTITTEFSTKLKFAPHAATTPIICG